MACLFSKLKALNWIRIEFMLIRLMSLMVYDRFQSRLSYDGKLPTPDTLESMGPTFLYNKLEDQMPSEYIIPKASVMCGALGTAPVLAPVMLELPDLKSARFFVKLA